MWVLHYIPEHVSQPWSILETFDERVHAIIKAYQVSHQYYMVKVTDVEGRIIWSS